MSPAEQSSQAVLYGAVVMFDLGVLQALGHDVAGSSTNFINVLGAFVQALDTSWAD